MTEDNLDSQLESNLQIDPYPEGESNEVVAGWEKSQHEKIDKLRKTIPLGQYLNDYLVPYKINYLRRERSYQNKCSDFINNLLGAISSRIQVSILKTPGTTEELIRQIRQVLTPDNVKKWAEEFDRVHRNRDTNDSRSVLDYFKEYWKSPENKLNELLVKVNSDPLNPFEEAED